MSTWRRVALQLFPDQRRHIQNTSLTSSVYDLLFDLLPMTVEAHESGNQEFLHRSYQFAGWCWAEKGRSGDYLYNAVCAAFYEHLVDHVASRNAIPYWLKPEIFEDIRHFLADQMTQDEYKQLLDAYNTVNHTNFRQESSN